VAGILESEGTSRGEDREADVSNARPVMPLAPPLVLLSSRAESPSEGRPSPGLDEDVRAAQRGDVAAFERLYRAHAGRVYALCLRLTADGPRAEALAQDSFVRAWERLGTFRGDSPFTSWLRQVTVNVVMAEQRAASRRARRVTTTDDDAVLDGPAAPRSDAERLDLERAIRALPDAARTVFVLHDVEGYGHEEIAGLMGIAEGTSKAHLHKARGKLQEILR
jgi:RNA polymerase sigma-70 factor (ECF subfamily)